MAPGRGGIALHSGAETQVYSFSSLWRLPWPAPSPTSYVRRRRRKAGAACWSPSSAVCHGGDITVLRDSVVTQYGATPGCSIPLRCRYGFRPGLPSVGAEQGRHFLHQQPQPLTRGRGRPVFRSCPCPIAPVMAAACLVWQPSCV